MPKVWHDIGTFRFLRGKGRAWGPNSCSLRDQKPFKGVLDVSIHRPPLVSHPAAMSSGNPLCLGGEGDPPPHTGVPNSHQSDPVAILHGSASLPTDWGDFLYLYHERLESLAPQGLVRFCP